MIFDDVRVSKDLFESFSGGNEEVATSKFSELPSVSKAM
jgi:hypothetical protein